MTGYVRGSALIVITAVLAGCSAQPTSGEIVWPHEPGSSAAAAIPEVAVGEPLTFGGLVLCVKGADVGTVVDVRASAGSSLQIGAFSVREQPAVMFGADRVPLVAVVEDPTSRTVTAGCSQDSWSELLVEVSRAEGKVAHTDGLIVDYRVGESEGSFPVAFAITLCASGVECDPAVSPPASSGAAGTSARSGRSGPTPRSRRALR